MIATACLIRLQRWRRAYPLRVHMSVLLLLKIAALVAIYHYFFATAQRVPVDNEHVAQRLLHANT